MHLEVDSLCAPRASQPALHGSQACELDAPAYGYTYEKLFKEFNSEGEASRFDRYCLNEWLCFLGASSNSKVSVEMTSTFEETIIAFSNELGTKVAEKTVRNVRGRIKALQAFYMSALEQEAIPQGFREALLFGMERMGLTPGRLIRLVGQTAYKWARGDSSPDSRHKARCGSNMQRLEELLHFPPGTLAMRAWPEGDKVMAVHVDVPFRRYASVICGYEYRLKPEDTPTKLNVCITDYRAHKQQQTHMLASGEIVSLPLTQIWSSEDTAVNALQLIRFFFGFLRLPKASGAKKPWPELLNYGMGFALDDLRFTMLVQKDLLFQYMLYAEQRSFDRMHFEHYEAQKAAVAKGFAPHLASNQALRKTLPSSYLRFLGLCLNLLNKPTGFLRMHPEFGQELPTPVAPENWEAWCLARHAELLALYKVAASKVEYNKRSNKEVLAPILRMEDPREAFFRVVDAMKNEVPADTAPIWQAVHWRNMTIVALLTFECIRAKNVWMLDIGRHITLRDGKYVLFVPKEEMKNFIHGYAEDIHRVFPEDLQELLHAWVTVYRPKFPGHDKTNALFVRHATAGPKPEGREDVYRMDTNTVSEAVGKVTKKYLGVKLRAHSLRNVNATSVVKQGGSIHQLKAVLNDSERTASEIYLDITNADQTQKLTDLYTQSRARVTS